MQPTTDIQTGLALGRGAQASGGVDTNLLQERALLYNVTGNSAFLSADHFYDTQFTALNASGVSGGAVAAYNSSSHVLTVAIAADGLEPNQVHIQHIHGFLDGTKALTPTAAQDTDHDGYIELAEGASRYGPILLNLSHDGGSMDMAHMSSSALSGFPTAPNGKEYFVQSYQLPADSLSTDPMLALREIVIHGESVPAGAGAGTGGEVDGTAGYKLVLPVASGELHEVTSAHDLRTLVGDIHLRDYARADEQSAHASGLDSPNCGCCSPMVDASHAMLGHSAMADGWLM